jgi:phosphoribosylpyrophosphate synthetase
MREPARRGGDYSLRFPFAETFTHLVTMSCPVDHIGIRRDAGGKPSCYTYLKCAEEQIGAARRWVASFASYVAIRDCMTLSFALDFDRQDGAPDKRQTVIGQLRSQAKPYDRRPTKHTRAAAEQLVARCLEFLNQVPCYAQADAVVAVPPSNPGKPFDLPTYAGQRIAAEWRRADLTGAVRTVKPREPVKTAPLGDKLARLEETMEASSAVAGRTIVLIDDLYQSGTTMNYVAMKLLDAGALDVYGLAIEKTCRNDSNVALDDP